MRALALCLVVALAIGLRPAQAADAAPLTPADHRAIEQVIAGQIDAFRRDAGEAAFGFAAPKLRAMFGTAGNFMAMVRQGYAPVYRPRSFAFGSTDTTDGRVVQQVDVVGPDGADALALYTMEREPDGSWRIAGCALARPRRVTT